MSENPINVSAASSVPENMSFPPLMPSASYVLQLAIGLVPWALPMMTPVPVVPVGSPMWVLVGIGTCYPGFFAPISVPGYFPGTQPFANFTANLQMTGSFQMIDPATSATVAFHPLHRPQNGSFRRE